MDREGDAEAEVEAEAEAEEDTEAEAESHLLPPHTGGRGVDTACLKKWIVSR